jgi:hypothetical protein
MSYSQLYLQNKGPRVPVPVAAILVVVLTVVFGRFFLTSNTTNTKASNKTVRRVEVANVSPFQVNLFWQSENPEEGYVFYGESLDEVKNIALDDRDLSEKKGLYLNHYVTLRNLKPGQAYFFKIVAKDQVVMKPDGSLYSFKTPVSSSTSSTLKPANGKILKENLIGQDNAIVLLYVEGMHPLSAMTKSSGEWLIPLNSFYDQEKLESRALSDTQKVKVEILSEDNKKSVLNGRLSNLSPVTTTVVIGKSYDLTDSGSRVLSAQSSNANQKEIDIIYPVEGALIPGRAPLIKGAARPKTQVFVTVNSRKTFSAVVTADFDGVWSYALPESLELGNHTVTITTKDKNGKDVTMTRKFVIIANDYEGKVLGEASGSPTIVVTSTPAPTVTSAPTTGATMPVSSITPTALMNTGITDIIPVIGGISFIVVGLGFLLVF